MDEFIKELNMLPHNYEAYQKVMAHYDSGRNKAAVVHATGTGKSYIIAAVAHAFNKVIVVAPNNFVLDETRKLCGKNVIFRTYASMMKGKNLRFDYDLIILDEFHRAGADEWGKGVEIMLKSNPTAKLLGTSATAIRYLDNERNMADELFDGEVVSSLQLRNAIDLGIIPEPTYVASLYSFSETYLAMKNKIMTCKGKTEDEKMRAMRKLNGIAHNWKNAQGVGLIMRKYLDKNIKRIIVFCSKVERAAKARTILAPWLASAGFKRMRFYNIDYKEKHLEREMADFQEDNFEGVKVAISVNMLNEGVHIPYVDAVVMMRSTVSPNIILQQIGRCLTAKKTGHKPVIIDLVNNMDTLGDFCGWQFNETKTAIGVMDDDLPLDKGFPFHIIDECRDIRTFLTQIQAEFDRTVDYYSMFWDFIKKYNRLPKSNNKDEIRLYYWCGYVWRNNYHLKETYPDVYEKIKEMGFCSPKGKTEKKAKMFWEFIEMYNRLPKQSIKSERSLYNWCARLWGNDYSLKDRFPDIYYKMEEMGWGKRTEMISQEYAKRFFLFIQEHGRVPMVSDKDVSDLYDWCSRVCRDNNLSERFPDVRAKLVEMNFATFFNKRITERTKELFDFIEKNGRIPQCMKENEKSLFNWCQRVMSNDRGMAEKAPEAYAKLKEMGWGNHCELQNNKKRGEFLDFIEKYKRMPSIENNNEKSLYGWFYRIGKKSPDILKKAIESGYNWHKTATKIWCEKFWSFINTHGRLPECKGEIDGERDLYLWCKRFSHKKLNMKERLPDIWKKMQELGWGR